MPLAYLQVGERANSERHIKIFQMHDEIAVFEALDAVVNTLHMQLLERFPDILSRPLLACRCK